MHAPIKICHHAALETNFSRVLDSIEQTFNEQQVKLLEDKQFDLDVQIEVLETQLKRRRRSVINTIRSKRHE